MRACRPCTPSFFRMVTAWLAVLATPPRRAMERRSSAAFWRVRLMGVPTQRMGAVRRQHSDCCMAVARWCRSTAWLSAAARAARASSSATRASSRRCCSLSASIFCRPANCCCSCAYSACSCRRSSCRRASWPRLSSSSACRPVTCSCRQAVRGMTVWMSAMFCSWFCASGVPTRARAYRMSSGTWLPRATRPMPWS